MTAAESVSRGRRRSTLQLRQQGGLEFDVGVPKAFLDDPWVGDLTRVHCGAGVPQGRPGARSERVWLFGKRPANERSATPRSSALIADIPSPVLHAQTGLPQMMGTRSAKQLAVSR